MEARTRRWRLPIRLPTASILARNAFWNVVTGMSAAMISVALPPFLARLLDKQSFGAWLLALQIAGYVNLLNFGFQVIVGQMVAQANATNDTPRRDKVVATAFFALAVAGAVGVVALFGLSTQVGAIAPAALPSLRPQIAAAIVVLAVSFAIQLPTSVFSAVFIGLQRNSFYSLSFLTTRMLTVVCVLVAACIVPRIVPMAGSWLLASAVGAGVAGFLWRRYSPEPRLSVRDFSVPILAAMARAGAPLTVWNLGMLMVSGLQLVIVARFDYAQIGPFGVASSISLFGSGVVQAVCSTLIPHAAHTLSIGQNDKVRGALANMTMLSTLLSGGITAVLIAGGGLIMHVWLGKNFSAAATVILALLAVAQFIRNLMSAYIMVAVAAGVQGRMMIQAFGEGFVSLGSAIVLGHRFGAVGVAAGMCLGSVVGVTIIAVQNVLRAVVDGFELLPYLRRNVLGPSVGVAMTAAAFALSEIVDKGSPEYTYLAFGFAVVTTVLLCRRYVPDLIAFLSTSK
jgi:O-antigen/teichoic acid export membrane protein